MDVLIVADTRSSPEMRHEVPLVVPDPFLYAEHDGARYAAVTSFEKGRIEDLGLGIDVLPWEELGIDELLERGLRPHEIFREISLRACRASTQMWWPRTASRTMSARSSAGTRRAFSQSRRVTLTRLASSES